MGEMPFTHRGKLLWEWREIIPVKSLLSILSSRRSAHVSFLLSPPWKWSGGNLLIIGKSTKYASNWDAVDDGTDHTVCLIFFITASSNLHISELAGNWPSPFYRCWTSTPNALLRGVSILFLCSKDTEWKLQTWAVARALFCLFHYISGAWTFNQIFSVLGVSVLSEQALGLCQKI